MISERSTKLLEDMGNSAYGKALTEFLEEEITKLNDVRTCSGLDDLAGRKYALRVIDKLFHFIRKDTPTDSTKNQYV